MIWTEDGPYPPLPEHQGPSRLAAALAHLRALAARLRSGHAAGEGVWS